MNVEKILNNTRYLNLTGGIIKNNHRHLKRYLKIPLSLSLHSLNLHRIGRTKNTINEERAELLS